MCKVKIGIVTHVSLYGTDIIQPNDKTEMTVRMLFVIVESASRQILCSAMITPVRRNRPTSGRHIQFPLPAEHENALPAWESAWMR